MDDYLGNNENTVNQIITHELAHCFGFRYSMLPYLRYENGDPRTRRNNLTRQPELGKHVNEGLEADQNTIKYVWREWQTVVGKWRIKRVGLTLPGVVSYARKHFGCNNLDAVELESDGGRGSDLSHFERRLSIGEIMSAVHDPMAAVSNLTLFYFNETGWYHVNFLMAELWNWGRNQGCEFLYKSCGEFIKRQKMSGQQTSTWCDKVLSETSDVRCIPHTNAYGYCNLIKHSHYLKWEHAHFDNLANISTLEQQMMGGRDKFADFCPYFSVFTSINESPMNSHCEDTDNQKFQNMTNDQQHYGKKSRCFNFNTVFMQSRNHISKAGCFRINCTLRHELQVKFNGKWHLCPKEGGTLLLPVDQYREDRLECPPFGDVCSVEEIKKRKQKRRNRISEDVNTIKTNRL